MFKKVSKGFTLIELLVVIAIIAILAVLVIIRVSNAALDARNSRRASDLNQIRSAIEQHKAKGSGIVNTSAAELDAIGGADSVCAAGPVLPCTINTVTKANMEGTDKVFETTSNPPSSFLSGSEYPKDPNTTTTYYEITVEDSNGNYTLKTNATETGASDVIVKN